MIKYSREQYEIKQIIPNILQGVAGTDFATRLQYWLYTRWQGKIILRNNVKFIGLWTFMVKNL